MPAQPTRPQGRTAGPARSLADDVRRRSQEQLATLVQRRPDLARPAPADLTSLAARASTRASVQRAVDGLDEAHLRVLRELATAPLAADGPAAAAAAGTDGVAEAVAAALAAPVDEVRACVDYLRELALVWEGHDGPRLVRTATDVLNSRPARPEPRPPTPAPAPAPGQRHVGGDPPEEPRAARDGGLQPPRLLVQARDPEAVDDVGGAAAVDVLERVEELAETWGLRPPRVLRAGGLAVRDLRRLAGQLDVGESQAAFLVEVAYAAGLVAEDASDPLDQTWAPTTRYDEWQQGRPHEQWARLASAWLGSPRAAHRVGTAPSERGSGTVNALSPEVLSSPSRQVRLEVLAEVALLAPGEAPAVESLLSRLAWRRPMRPAAVLEPAALAALQEAEWIGATGRGALTSAGRALVAGAGANDLAAAARDAMPRAVDHVLLQADLTAVAPGRLEGELAALMRLVADVESRGGATVYRFSADSVRRAMDAGWSADRLLSALRNASATPVPQPLDYLVGDVARRHGATRVGAVTTYVRSDDTATLDAMEKERALAALQLRRIAPTVLVTKGSPDTVLEVLRGNGFAPVVEGPDGGVRVPRPHQHRAVGRLAPAPVTVSVVDRDSATSLVRSLRAAEDVAQALRDQDQDRPGPPLPSTDPMVALALLREAVATSRPLWIGYSDRDGIVTRHLFWPRRVEGGRAYGLVDGSSLERAFSIHRITGASVG